MLNRKIAEVQRALAPLLKGALLKGSTCWGIKSSDNPHSGVNLIFRVGGGMVTISQPGEGLVIQVFEKTVGTKLEKQVRDLLQEAGLIQERKRPFSGGYTASCNLGGWTAVFDPGPLAEVDGRGAGGSELAEEICRSHELVHPCCDPANLRVLDQDGKEFREFATLTQRRPTIISAS